MAPSASRRKPTRPKPLADGSATSKASTATASPVRRSTSAKTPPPSKPTTLKEETATPTSTDSRKRKRGTKESERRMPKWTPDKSPSPSRAPSPTTTTTTTTTTSDPLPTIPGYTVTSLLGAGNFSRTYLCHPASGAAVAIKRYHPAHTPLGESEASILASLPPCPQICRFLGALPLATPHITLEPLLPSRPLALPSCPHATTCAVLTCPERLHALAKIMRQLLGALQHLHSNHLIHADVTPANILYLTAAPSQKLKLIDFSNCIHPAVLGVYKPGDDVQTPCYRAPEILLGSHAPSSRIDVFSAGVIAVELLLGGERLGDGVEGAELLHACVEDRDGLIRRHCELFGTLEGLREGVWWREAYADIVGRWAWRKGEGRRKVGEKKGMLREMLEGAGEVGAWLQGMLEMVPEKRVTAAEALRGEWLVGELLGEWGRLLVQPDTPGPVTNGPVTNGEKEVEENGEAEEEEEPEEEEDISFV